MDISRRRSLNVLEEHDLLGPHDDLPLVPSKVDVHLFAGRHDQSQPFFFSGSKDMLICILQGRGRIEFRETSVLHQRVEPGDYVLIPARTPHRVVPDEELVQIRYKAAQPGIEAVCWYCDGCGRELHRVEYDADTDIPQERWQLACDEFNADVTIRTCDGCGAVAPSIDLSGIRWRDIAEALRRELLTSN